MDTDTEYVLSKILETGGLSRLDIEKLDFNHLLEILYHNYITNNDIENIELLYQRFNILPNIFELFYTACKEASVELIKFIFEKIPESYNIFDRFNMFANVLFQNNKVDKISMMKYFISKGLNLLKFENNTGTKLYHIDELYDDGIRRMCLHEALIQGSLESFSFFIEKGLSIDEVHILDLLMMVKRISSEPEQKISQVLDFWNKILKQDNIQKFDSEFKNFVLNSKYQYNSEWECSHLDMVYAMKTKAYEVVKYLMEKGMPVMPNPNDLDRSPLYYAFESNNLEMVKYMVEKGAKIYDIDEGIHFNFGEHCDKYDKDIEYFEMFEYLASKYKEDKYKHNNTIIFKTYEKLLFLKSKSAI